MGPDRETAIEKLVRQHGSQADVDEFLDRQSRRADHYAWMRRQGRGKSQRIVQEIEEEVLSLRTTHAHLANKPTSRTLPCNV